MNEYPEIYRLAEALANHIKGDATPEDNNLVEDWLSRSPANRSLLKKISSRDFINLKYITRKLCDPAAAFDKVSRRREKYGRRRRMLYAASGIAAAASLFWAVVSVFHPSGGGNDQVIHPGSSQAILTLGDGREIRLGAGRQDTVLLGAAASITATADDITYNDAKTDEQVRYDRIYLPRKGEYRITLSDGTRIHINSESTLEFPANFPKNERRVVFRGEAFFEVSPDANRPFIVEVNGLDVRVMGTSFNIRAYTDEPYIYTTLISGGVELATTSNKTTLTPGQQGYFDPATGIIEKRDVDTRLYASWKDGRFVFENQSLEEIMSVLKRWYDFDVVFGNESARSVKFYGNIDRYDDFNKVIDMFGMTGEAKFGIDGNKVRID